MHVDKFNEIKDTIPKLPGVYQFYNKDNTVIYVGKAISLYNRVMSYFRSPATLSAKTKELVQHIHHLDWIACPDENDALLLENNLIKKWQPKYNINLKDDKTYPYIIIRNEAFPRVYMTRKRTIGEKAECYGPYTSIQFVNDLLQHIRDEIPLRTCTLNLSATAIAKGKYKACLEYHIEKCKAPCIGLQTEADYLQSIAEIRMLLKGNFSSLAKHYKTLMMQEAEQLHFEEAHKYKEKIVAISNLKHKSFFEFSSEEDVDIFCFKKDTDSLWVNFSTLRQGCIMQSKVMEYHTTHTAEIDEDAIPSIIIELQQSFNSSCRNIISNIPVKTLEHIAFYVPQRGIKKEMITWALQNIDHHISNKQKQVQKEHQQLELLQKMQLMLHLPSLPLHIESFDNSHLQGFAQVSAMVCFKNGQPSKKDYRTFHIKSVQHADDYASMREVIYRRYLRRMNEGKTLPDLIIIDGGKGQLHEAKKSLEDLQLDQKIAILSIAKKQEFLFFPDDKEPIILDKRDPVLQLIQQIRDETHRFVIGFHRKSQIKKSLKSEDSKN